MDCEYVSHTTFSPENDDRLSVRLANRFSCKPHSLPGHINENKESPMLKKFALAAATAGALSLGSLLSVTPSQAAGVAIGTSPAIQSNVIDARCWRNRHGRLRCDNRRRWHRAHKHKHCWWRHGTRHCVWR
jgi:hypothetical protein